MTAFFQKAHDFTARWEGGLSDHPADPGGLTKYGVSLRWVQDLARQAREDCLRQARSCDGCSDARTQRCGYASLDMDMDGDVDGDDIRACTKAQAAAWAPIRHDDRLHDRASYRYFWQVVERAHRTDPVHGLPAEVRLAWFGDATA